MPSKKGIEQALIWLRSKAMEKDSLDGINAELTLNVIYDLKRQRDRAGATIHNMQMREKAQALNGYSTPSREEQAYEW